MKKNLEKYLIYWKTSIGFNKLLYGINDPNDHKVVNVPKLPKDPKLPKLPKLPKTVI